MSSHNIDESTLAFYSIFLLFSIIPLDLKPDSSRFQAYHFILFLFQILKTTERLVLQHKC